MEIVWEDPPSPEGPVFNKDLYDKIGFGPTIQELWTLLQSPQHDVRPQENSTVHDGSPPPGGNDREESSWMSVDSKDSTAKSEDPKTSTEPLKKKPKCKVPFPEPRVPYPFISALSKSEQKKYLDFLHSNKKEIPLSQLIYSKVNDETRQFMTYLQDVSRMCAEDYSVISQAALQYSEEVFRSCLEHIKSLPPLYQIHEFTGLTSGKFKPELSLTFEKQLLRLGTVDIAHYRPMNAGAQVALDYQTVSSLCPPAKKAKEMHASVSSDSNAVKLCCSYEPHVCLTRDALVQLLNNHCPAFKEEWELPILIKANPIKDKCQKKTVFIDSPLLKSEMIVRERSLIFHEEALKLFISKASTQKISDVKTELPAREQQPDRGLVHVKSDSLDFEDLSDLETFGESSSNKTPNKSTKTEQGEDVQSKKLTHHTRRVGKQERNHSNQENNTVQSDSIKTKVNETTTSNKESDNSVPISGDSDDEKLIIDVSPKVTRLSPLTPNSDLSSPITRSRKQQKTCPSGDQLGEILQMQTAMFTSNSRDAAKPTSAPQEPSPSSKQSVPTHGHSTSLVKACVSSYLEKNPNQEEETREGLHSAAAPKLTECKKLLSQELREAVEDESHYESPEEGNLVYKLYSLDELLLLVRTPITLGHKEKLDNQNMSVPLKILPKLEYQLTYGVECLTSSEACQLWTERTLHSSAVFFTAHIDAFTSKPVMVRKLQEDWMHNLSCSFKPSYSLNILHHLLQKLTGLDEGQYLLRHKVGEPFVNILKTAPGNGRQGVYNLQQIHSDIPQPPASPSVPWVPLDPSVCLPFHRQNGRVPCTFPPQDYTPPQPRGKAPRHYNNKRGPPGGKKPKTKNPKNNFT